jgi:hypothetical protein
MHVTIFSASAQKHHGRNRAMCGLSDWKDKIPKTNGDTPRRTAALMLDHAKAVAITEEPEV